jgi:hypothetical protein
MRQYLTAITWTTWLKATFTISTTAIATIMATFKSFSKSSRAKVERREPQAPAAFRFTQLELRQDLASD